MKNLLAFIIVIFTLISSACLIADEFNPYVGAEAQIRYMNFKKNYGGNILKHYSPQRNFYMGIRPTEHFGIEIGYEATNTKSRTVQLQSGDIVNGVTIPKEFPTILFKSKAKIKGPSINVLAFYAPWEDMPIEFFGSIGISFIKCEFEREMLKIDQMHVSSIRSLSDRKPILRITTGIERMWTENLGTRVSIGLTKTNQMVIYPDDNVHSTYVPFIQPKDSIIYGYGLGLFYKF